MASFKRNKLPIIGGSKNRRLSTRELEWRKNGKPAWAKVLDAIRDGTNAVMGWRSANKTKKYYKNRRLEGPVTLGSRDVISRRSVLKNIAKVAAGTALAVSTVSGLKTITGNWSDYAESAEIGADLYSKRANPEKLENGRILPEDERKGQNIMISTSPEALFGVFFEDIEGHLENFVYPIVKSLDKESTVHLMVPKGRISEYKEKVVRDFPDREFRFYEYPNSPRKGLYAQDRYFFTGQKDKENRFELVASEYDYVSLDLDLEYLDVVWYQTNAGAEETFKRFSDDYLAEQKPEKFSKKLIPTLIRGGDLLVTRLPDGKSAAVVGKEVLLDSVVFLRLDDGEPREYVKGRLGDSEMRNYIRRVKDSYKEYMGVDEVIVLGEETIVDNKDGFTYLDQVTESRFFHADMVVKPITNPAGESVAFISNTELSKSGRATDSDGQEYLESARKQFSQHGFKIVDLPVGPNPAMNYANTVAFSPQEGKKVVLLPQYGIPEDGVAYKAYTDEGFEVRKVELSELKESHDSSSLVHTWAGKRIGDNYDDLNGGSPAAKGSLHCTAVVMD